MRLPRGVAAILLWGVSMSALAQTSPAEHRATAEALFSEAEELRNEYREELSRQAIEKYALAAQNWLEASDMEQAASATQRIGDVQIGLGELERALESYRKAERFSQEASSEPIRSEILGDLGFVNALLGQDRQALEACNHALSLARSVNNAKGEAKALNCLGEVHYQLGGLSTSLEFYRQAGAICARLGDNRGQAESALGLGYAYSDSRELEKAREQFQLALSEWEEQKDKRGMALTLVALGWLHSRLGENQEALNFFNEAMTLLTRMGDKVWEASAASGVGNVYFQMNDFRMSLVYHRRALELFRAAGLPTAEMDSLLWIGDIQLASGDSQNALGHFREALGICQELGNLRCESWSRRLIGTTHRYRGELEMALDQYQLALSKIPPGEDPRSEALILGDIGNVHEEKGDLGKAEDFYMRARTLSHDTKESFAEAHWLYRLARLERSRENLAVARQHLIDALEKVESLRSEVESKDLRSSYLASVHPYFELYIDVLMSLDRAHPDEQIAAVAFQASEQARARSFLEMLTEARVDIRQGLAADLLERESALKGRLEERADFQVQFLSRGASEEEGRQVAEEIRQLTADYEQLQALIRSKSPLYAALTQPQPLSLQEIQREVLDDDTLLLEYSLGEKNSYLWAVSKTGYTSHVLPAAAEIETEAREVYRLLTARLPSPGESTRDYRLRIRDADSRYWAQAGRLSDILLAPVADEIRGKRLAIVSDGALQYVPFAALPVPGGAPGPEPAPLVSAHEVAWLPSASLLAVSRKEAALLETAPKTVAVFADPVFESDDPRVGGSRPIAPPLEEAADLTRALRDFGFADNGVFRVPRLPGTLREAEAIVSLVPESSSLKAIGFAASRSLAMSSELSQYRIIHFASHGLMNSDQAELSGILLSMFDENGQPQNGFLRLHDIYNLDLRAELVVLSACNTALGKEIRGEGLVGLARAFMYSGAKRILASLWKVDDEATGELMKRVYQGMLTRNLSPAAALREAQVSMWSEKRWRAPFFWSAFSVQGDWR